MTLQLFVPGMLVNPLNGGRSRWATMRQGLKWKRNVRLAWLKAGKPSWDGPATMALTCFVGGCWDAGALEGATKHLRDEAVRLMLDGNPPRRRDKRGRWYDVPANDGPHSGHAFPPPQQEIRRRAERGVLIQVTPKGGR